MKMSNIKGPIDFMEFYRKNDKNRDEKLDPSEIGSAQVRKYDLSGDGKLSPWEVMAASNRIHRRTIFSPKQISDARKSKNFFHLDYTLRSPTVIRKRRYVAGTKIGIYLNGQMKVELAENMTIDGYRFSRGTVIDYDTMGHLHSALLLSDDTIKGRKFPAGTSFWFLGKKKLDNVFIPKNCVINGISFTSAKLDGKFRLSSGTLQTDTYVYVLGKLRVFKGGTELDFFSTGEVAHGKLLREATFNINGKDITFKTEPRGISFYRKSVYYGWTAKNITIGGVEFLAGELVMFDKRGCLVSKENETYKFVSTPRYVTIEYSR